MLGLENGSLGVKVNGASNGESSREEGEERERERLVTIKLAEITGVVKGLEEEYSVIIKVLPTDDNERYKVRHKFRQVRPSQHFSDCLNKFSPQLLKFSKEVQVYMKIIKCMYM